MSDRRNEYRAVSHMDTFGERWRLQVKLWWWPFWITLMAYCNDTDMARRAALVHATKRKHVRQIVDLGRLP